MIILAFVEIWLEILVHTKSATLHTCNGQHLNIQSRFKALSDRFEGPWLSVNPLIHPPHSLNGRVFALISASSNCTIRLPNTIHLLSTALSKTIYGGKGKLILDCSQGGVAGVHCFYGTWKSCQAHGVNVILTLSNLPSSLISCFLPFIIIINVTKMTLILSMSGHPHFFNQLSLLLLLSWLMMLLLSLLLLLSGHPRFFNQLSCGLDVTSLAGEWLTATANTNMFTYEVNTKTQRHKKTKTQRHKDKQINTYQRPIHEEIKIKVQQSQIAPVFILMEHECLKKMREIIGWVSWVTVVGGIF